MWSSAFLACSKQLLKVLTWRIPGQRSTKKHVTLNSSTPDKYGHVIMARG